MKSKHGTIKSLITITSCCPTQWEGITKKNEKIYVRYRWGHLDIHLSDPDGTIEDAIMKRAVYSEQIGEEYDGELSSEELHKLIEENKLFNL